MFHIKKQINLLYITSILGNLSITGAWVAILAARGFSLVQIGFAETVFHITSLIFEIPSGLLADIYGRKKMLIVSQAMAVIGNMVMALSGGFWVVCVSLAFHALSYNFASGSGDALAYDSLKSVNLQDTYESYASNQMIIYRTGSAISTLCAGAALLIGYRPAYLLSVLTHLATLLITLKLKEIRMDEDGAGKGIKEKGTAGILKEVFRYFSDSILFLKNNGMAARLMFANSLVGAVDILLLFFLQAKLTAAGIPDWGLGIALFFMELGGIAGARLITLAGKAKYGNIFVLCAVGVMTGVMLEHTGMILAMSLGGFLSVMADDALQIRTDAKLQDMFPSRWRATLISLSSFTFSVIMIVLSPLAGWFFSIW